MENERQQFQWLRMMLEVIAIIVTNIVLLVGAYYKLDSRVLVAEQRIEQETRGYAVIQTDLHKRLERLEDKLDRLIEHAR